MFKRKRRARRKRPGQSPTKTVPKKTERKGKMKEKGRLEEGQQHYHSQ